GRRRGETAQQLVIAAPHPTAANALCRSAAKAWIEAVIVLDGIEAPGEAGIVERVEIDRVERHRGDARQLRGPAGDRPGKGRKQIVDAQTFGHRARSFLQNFWGATPLPWLAVSLKTCRRTG